MKKQEKLKVSNTTNKKIIVGINWDKIHLQHDD